MSISCSTYNKLTLCKNNYHKSKNFNPEYSLLRNEDLIDYMKKRKSKKHAYDIGMK